MCFALGNSKSPCEVLDKQEACYLNNYHCCIRAACAAAFCCPRRRTQARLPGAPSAAQGAFALGTVPLLFLFGALQSFLPRGWMKYGVKGRTVLVIALGLSMLVKGLQLLIAL